MDPAILAMIVGLMGGIVLGFQAPFVSLMSQLIGTMESIFIVHFGGALLAGLMLLAMRGGNLGAWQSVPWYALGSGTLGLAIVGTISYTTPRLGPSALFALLLIGQLMIGLVIDHFGLFGNAMRSVDLSRVAGVAVLFVGVWLVLR